MLWASGWYVTAAVLFEKASTITMITTIIMITSTIVYPKTLERVTC